MRFKQKIYTRTNKEVNDFYTEAMETDKKACFALILMYAIYFMIVQTGFTRLFNNYWLAGIVSIPSYMLMVTIFPNYLMNLVEQGEI